MMSGAELISFEKVIKRIIFKMKKATEYPKPTLEERLAKGQSQRAAYQRNY
jgi:hypothetical protein